MAAPTAPPSPADATAEVREFRSERWLALSNLPGDRAFRSFTVTPRAHPKGSDGGSSSNLRAVRMRQMPPEPAAKQRPPPPPDKGAAPPRRRRRRLPFRGRRAAASDAHGEPPGDRVDGRRKGLAYAGRGESADAGEYPAVHGSNSSPSLSGNIARAPMHNRGAPRAARIRSGFGFRRTAELSTPAPPLQTPIAAARFDPGRFAPGLKGASPPDVEQTLEMPLPPVRRSVSAPSFEDHDPPDHHPDEPAGARRPGRRPEPPPDAGAARRLLNRIGLMRNKYDAFNPDETMRPSDAIPWRQSIPKMRSEPDLSDAKPPPPQAVVPLPPAGRPRRGLFGARRREPQVDARARPRHASLPINSANPLEAGGQPPPPPETGEHPGVRRIFPFGTRRPARVPDRADPDDRERAEQVNAELANFSSLTNALNAVSPGGGSLSAAADDACIEPITPERALEGAGDSATAGVFTQVKSEEELAAEEEMNAFSGPVLVFSHPPPADTAAPEQNDQSLAPRLMSKLTEPSAGGGSGSSEGDDRPPEMKAIGRALSSMSSSPDPSADDVGYIMPAGDGGTTKAEDEIVPAAEETRPPSTRETTPASPARSWLAPPSPSHLSPRPLPSPPSRLRTLETDGGGGRPSPGGSRISGLFKPFTADASPNGQFGHDEFATDPDFGGGFGGLGGGEAWEAEPSSMEQRHLEHSDVETVYDDESTVHSGRTWNEGREGLADFLESAWRKTPVERAASRASAVGAERKLSVGRVERKKSVEALRPRGVHVERKTSVPALPPPATQKDPAVVERKTSVDMLPMRAPTFKEMEMPTTASFTSSARVVLDEVIEEEVHEEVDSGSGSDPPFLTPVASVSSFTDLQIDSPAIKHVESAVDASVVASPEQTVVIHASAQVPTGKPSPAPSALTRNADHHHHHHHHHVADRKSPDAGRRLSLARRAEANADDSPTFDDILEARARLRPSGTTDEMPRMRRALPSSGTLIDNRAPNMKDLLSMFNSKEDEAARPKPREEIAGEGKPEPKPRPIANGWPPRETERAQKGDAVEDRGMPAEEVFLEGLSPMHQRAASAPETVAICNASQSSNVPAPPPAAEAEEDAFEESKGASAFGSSFVPGAINHFAPSSQIVVNQVVADSFEGVSSFYPPGHRLSVETGPTGNISVPGSEHYQRVHSVNLGEESPVQTSNYQSFASIDSKKIVSEDMAPSDSRLSNGWPQRMEEGDSAAAALKEFQDFVAKCTTPPRMDTAEEFLLQKSGSKSPGGTARAYVEAVQVGESTYGETLSPIKPPASTVSSPRGESSPPIFPTLGSGRPDRPDPTTTHTSVSPRPRTIKVGTLRNHISVPIATAKAQHPQGPLPSPGRTDEDGPASSPEAKSPSMANVMAMASLSKASIEDRPEMRRTLFQDLGPITSKRFLAEGEFSSQSLARSDSSQFVFEPADWRNNSKLSLGFSDVAERVESMHSVGFEYWGRDSSGSSLPFASPNATGAGKVGEEVGNCVAEFGSSRTFIVHDDVEDDMENQLEDKLEEQVKDDVQEERKEEGADETARLKEQLAKRLTQARTADDLPHSLPRVESAGSLSSDEDLEVFDSDTPQHGTLYEEMSSFLALEKQIDAGKVVVATKSKMSSTKSTKSEDILIANSVAMDRLPKPLKPVPRFRDSPSSSDGGFSASTYSAPSLGRRPRAAAASPGLSATPHIAPLELNGPLFDVGSGSEHSQSSSDLAALSTASGATDRQSTPYGTLSMPTLGRRPGGIGRPSTARPRSKMASDFGNAPLDPPAAGDLSWSDKSGARALVRSESDVRAAMSSPTILHAGSDEEGDADASGPKSANSSLLSARRGFSVGQRRSRQLSSNPGSFMSFSSGQLRPSRRLSMRARRASAIDDMAAERDMLAEAVRREKAERAAVAQEVLSMQNAVKNSKKAVENSDRRICALMKELDELYDECPRLDRRLPEIKDGFLYKEMALASAIRLWVDQTGGIGIDMKAEGKEEIAPVAMLNVSPYSPGLS